MRITEITVYKLELPLVEPYHLSRGRLFERLDSTFVRIATDADIIGWGEVCPWGSTYLPAYSRGVRAGVAELAPHLIGLDPQRPEVLTRAMDSALSGHLYAKAAIDYAIWDIMGKATGLPIYDLLGGKESDPVPLVSSIHLDTPDAMLARVEYWRQRGYLRHSLKLGEGVDSDIARVRQLAGCRREDEEFIFDVNGGWSPWEAVRIMNAVSDVEAWFEQPCATYDQCLSVRGQTQQALSLDECIVDVRDVVRALADNSFEILNIKLARVGGLTRARWIRDLCLAVDIPLVVMCMGGSVLNDTPGFRS